ncbi:MAG: hypothetical protein QOJ44_2124, partial [Acidimicrobiaceae bacterium]|nr:hypothetical protein [Acidimicrobiaceae bacterium]
ATATSRIQVADRATLEPIARRLGGAIIQGDNGWQSVLGPDPPD